MQNFNRSRGRLLAPGGSCSQGVFSCRGASLLGPPHPGQSFAPGTPPPPRSRSTNSHVAIKKRTITKRAYSAVMMRRAPRASISCSRYDVCLDSSGLGTRRSYYTGGGCGCRVVRGCFRHVLNRVESCSSWIRVLRASDGPLSSVRKVFVFLLFFYISL